MAITVKASGSQAAILNTEHQLVDTADLGTYALLVNTTPLARGETLELKLQGKAASGGSYAVAFLEALAHAQSQPLFQSFHLLAPYGCRATLKQIGGTGRTFEWALIRLDS